MANNTQINTGALNEQFYQAAGNGNQDLVECLLKIGADPNFEHKGFTVFFNAVRNGHKEVVKLMLDCGADVNKPTITGYYPLDIAVLKGYEEIVHTLVKHGAHINSTNSVDMTPFDEADLMHEVQLFDQKTLTDQSLSCRKNILQIIFNAGGKPYIKPVKN